MSLAVQGEPLADSMRNGVRRSAVEDHSLPEIDRDRMAGMT